MKAGTPRKPGVDAGALGPMDAGVLEEHRILTVRKNGGNHTPVTGKNGSERVRRPPPDQILLLVIPIHLIRVFKEQPRQEFDQEELEGLSESMEEVEQQLPVTVRRITDNPPYKFELIDGERRLKAARLRGKTEILALVVNVKSKDEQFIRAVAANFCREGHTHIETARAAKRIYDSYLVKFKDSGKALETTRKIFGHRSVSWVWQYIGLLRLCEEVQELVKEEKISFQVGVALTNFKHEQQLKLATEIVARGYHHKKALHHVRRHRNEDSLTENARVRKPSDDYVMLVRALRRIHTDAEIILDMKYPEVERVFKTRTIEDVQAAISLLGTIGEGVGMLKATLEEFLLAKKKERDARR